MPVPLRVLILEDRKSDLELILRELERAGFAPEGRFAATEKDYAASLSPDLDVILADYSLPQFDALKALHLLKERGLAIPFIVVTGSLSEEAAVACLKNGATDYLLKDRLARLGSAIGQALESRKNLEAKRAAEEEIRRRNRELVLLNRIIAVSAESSDERHFLTVACRELAAAVGARRVVVLLINDERTQARVAADAGAEEPLSIVGRILEFIPGTMGAMLCSLKTPIVMNDLSAHPETDLGHEIIFSQRAAALCLVPMLMEGLNMGALALAADAPGHFSGDLVDLARSVADQLSSALARHSLERERRRLGTALEQASDAVVILDTDYLIQYVNPAFERITGVERSEAIGRSFESVAHGGRKPDFARILEEAGREGKEWRGRLEHRHQSGKLYTVDLLLSLIRDKTGAVVNYVGVLRDITEELAMEQRFRQAQKMEAVGRLAGGVAHDFNNLLTAIMGYAAILADRLEERGQDQTEVTEIQRAAGRAADLTKQLLAFSRKQVLKPRVVNLNVIVRTMERMLRPVIGEDIEVFADLDPSLGPVMADPGQIEQVIMNLAVNARDAMPSGGRLILSTRNAAFDERYAREHPGVAPGAYVLLSVKDTGTGLSDEVLPHLFEPFFTTKEEGKGTGLGLATVYGIVRQSGGHIVSSSESGKGTTFEIQLPRLEGEAAPAEGTEDLEDMPRGTERVLLVEDNEMVKDLVSQVLARQGYVVTAAGRPDEALTLFAATRRRFDLLVTDMVMPGMDGRQLAARMRAARPGLKVLLISGYTDTSFISEGKLEPGTAFLQKPFTPRVLLQAVREVLDGRA